MTIEADEPLDYLGLTDVSMSGSRVLDLSVAESDEGRTWVATGTVQATSDDDEEPLIQHSQLQDEAGNSGTPPPTSIEYDGADPIFIDTIAPEITRVTASLPNQIAPTRI